MTEGWIFNASPLILFARINGLDFFEKLAVQILVPDAVIAEIYAGESDDPSAPVSLAFAQQHRVPDIIVPATVANWDLGSGESQVLSHAIHSDAWAVLDDLAARRCAKAHEIRVIGSLGVILRAKRKGVVTSAAPWIAKLKGAGMFVDDRLIRAVLDSVGESWEADKTSS